MSNVEASSQLKRFTFVMNFRAELLTNIILVFNSRDSKENMLICFHNSTGLCVHYKWETKVASCSFGSLANIVGTPLSPVPRVEMLCRTRFLYDLQARRFVLICVWPTTLLPCASTEYPTRYLTTIQVIKGSTKKITDFVHMANTNVH